MHSKNNLFFLQTQIDFEFISKSSCVSYDVQLKNSEKTS